MGVSVGVLTKAGAETGVRAAFSLQTSPNPENMSILANSSHPASIGLNAPETCLSAAGDLDN